MLSSVPVRVVALSVDDFAPGAMPSLRRDAMHALRFDALERSRKKGCGDRLADGDTYALQQLLNADLLWVSSEMSQLCHDATADLREAHLGRDL